jgi:hypothetical protein
VPLLSAILDPINFGLSLLSPIFAKAITMAIDVRQFGGYTGSYAGDCCVIGNDGHYLMIDLGRDQGGTSLKPKGTQAAKGTKIIGTGKAEIDVIVTHFHADHIDNGWSWAQLQKQGAKIHHGAAVDSSHVDNLRRVFGNAATQYTPEQNGTQIFNKAIGGWQVAAWVIVPTFAQFTTSLDENDASLGALIELTDGNQDISILTVGDMTPRAGDAAITAVLQARGYDTGNGGKKIKCVKLSHHGSENNLLPALDHVIGNDTTVLISGYTMTQTPPLVAKLKKWAPKRVCMLLDKAGKSEFDACLQGSASLKSLQSANIEFLEDFWVPLP